ncbi:MAG: carbohydrate binding family 9 domain-containing protein [bacterium]|nr:carbohydrate binding family 9 domain-containing protein [bacterium]
MKIMIKKSILIISVLFMVLGVVKSQVGAEKIFSDKDVVIQANYTKTPPKIDGKLDDACWKAAKPATNFTVYQTIRTSDLRTFGYLAYDNSHIYIAVNCLDPEPENIKALVSEHGEKVFKDDSIEIMIDPGRTLERYFQFVVSAGGGTFEVRRARGGAGEDDDWRADWQAATMVNADGWSVELAIPYHALQITQNPGREWGINFCRNKKFPREMSATAEKGIYNHAPGFLVAKGIKTDFSKFQLEVGEGESRFFLRDGKPLATVMIPVINRTGKTASLKIDYQSINKWREQNVHSRTIRLKPNGFVKLKLEPQRLQQMIIGQSDRYFIFDPPAVEMITISDAVSGEMLTRINANLPLMCTAVHVQVKQLKSRLVLEIKQNIEESLLEKGTLRVCISKRGSLQPIFSMDLTKPYGGKIEAVFTKKLPPGAYLASAVFLNGDGQVVAESIRPVTVQPSGAKVLNNFVTQLLDMKGVQALTREEFKFFNPRTGWIFVRSTSELSKSDIRLVLNNGPKNEAIIVHKADTESTLEAKRFLAVGEHSIQVHGGKLSHLVVRTIPEIIYPGGGRAKIQAFGTYDWKFMKKYIHKNITTIRAGHDYGPKHPFGLLSEAKEWKKAGGHWLFHTGVPIPSKRWNKELTAENAYEYWTDNFAFREPAIDGHMADEINGGTAEMFKAWAEAVRWFSADAKYKYKVFIPWVAQIYGSEAGRLFMNVLLGSGRHRYAYKRYLADQPTLAETKTYLRQTLIDDVIGWTQGIEGGMEGLIVCFGIFSMPNETCNTNPGTNFKVFQDMEWNMVANNPIYKGVGGIQTYTAPYCDPETHRWLSKLIRHYCIEGNTEMCSDDPYELTHIKHPDYPDPTKGWTVIEAEPGATSVGRLPRYNFLIGAYQERAELDYFLRMKRSAKGPNSFSQEINDLEPGRSYSMKMIVADYNDIDKCVSKPLKPTFTVNLEDVDLLPSQCFDSPFVNNYGHSWRKFNRENRAHFIYVWRVFRAKGKTSKLTVSDWKTDTEPGGPIGQELMFNFIEIQPYFGE